MLRSSVHRIRDNWNHTSNATSTCSLASACVMPVTAIRCAYASFSRPRTWASPKWVTVWQREHRQINRPNRCTFVASL
jgi:hypothetical protein